MRRDFAVPVLLAVAVLSGCGGSDPFPNDDELLNIRGLYNPATPEPDPTNVYGDMTAARDLGEKLFSDKGFSACGAVACETCHPGPAYTVATAAAHGCGGDTSRNPPSLLNTAFNQWFMWDGRKDTLWGQASGPLLNPVEMAASPESIQARLASNYASEYQAVFGVLPQDETDPDKVVANFGKAVAAYERTLTRVNSPFDQKVQHFIASAEQGQAEQDPFYPQLHAFVRRGRCSVCHKNASLSDGNFHDIGLADANADRGRSVGIDELLADPYNSSQKYSDAPSVGSTKLAALQGTETNNEGAFKTPTLRNVALTAPYMHNGSLKTLDDVINFYDRGGDRSGFAGVRTTTIIPLYLSDTEKAALKDLLESLTGSENP